MAYSRTWDNSFPPDTQQASLLGQDIRNLKGDIQERLLLSGILANRPTPEAGFVGLVFIATDTRQAFSWSGTGWVDITSSLPGVFRSYALGNVTHTGDTSLYTVYSTQLPALVAGTNGFVRLTFSDFQAAPTNINLQISLGGTVVENVFTGIGQAGAFSYRKFEFIAGMSGSATAQSLFINFWDTGSLSPVSGLGRISNTTIDMTQPVTLLVQAKNAAASDTITWSNFILEALAQ